jgi:hypothetical protein
MLCYEDGKKTRFAPNSESSSKDIWSTFTQDLVEPPTNEPERPPCEASNRTNAGGSVSGSG